MIGNLVFLCFILTQLVDGIATLHGVSLSGTSIEGNPLLRFLMERYDPGLVIIAAKSVTVSLGLWLYTTDRYYALATTTVFYLLFAVLPWILVLS
jgi:hypothetical protein